MDVVTVIIAMATAAWALFEMHRRSNAEKANKQEKKHDGYDLKSSMVVPFGQELIISNHTKKLMNDGWEPFYAFPLLTDDTKSISKILVFFRRRASAPLEIVKLMTTQEQAKIVEEAQRAASQAAIQAASQTGNQAANQAANNTHSTTTSTSP